MKKILSSVVIASALLVQAGCSTLNSQAVVAPGQAKAILVDVVGGKGEAGKTKNEFYFGDMVYMYVSLGWDDSQRAQSLNAKWVNAAGQVVAAKTYQPQYLKKPHHVWFWINSAQVGKGAVHAEVSADGQVFSIPFTVLEPLKQKVKTPWYKRIFKKKPVDEKLVIASKGV